MRYLGPSICLATVLVCLPVFAGDCPPVPQIRQAFAEGEVIFWGRILEKEEVRSDAAVDQAPRDLFRYTVVVVERYKGQVADTVFVHSGTGGGDHGYLFHTNNAYLIYATTLPVAEGLLYTSECTRTKPYYGHEARLLGRLSGGRGF